MKNQLPPELPPSIPSLAPVIRRNPKELIRELSLLRWGFIPSWAKDPSVAASTINARSETAGTKRAFRDALKYRRCLIPADGFYEWQRRGKAKQPYCFEVNRSGEQQQKTLDESRAALQRTADTLDASARHFQESAEAAQGQYKLTQIERQEREEAVRIALGEELNFQ